MRKLSISNINGIIQHKRPCNFIEVPITCNNKTYTITFKPVLSFEEEEKFVARIVNFAFTKNNQYAPLCAELGKYIAIIECFTNIELPLSEDKEQIDYVKLHDFIQSINLPQIVKNMFVTNTSSDEHRLAAYINSLCVIADNKIKYLKDKYNTLDLNTLIASHITLNQKYDDLLTGLNTMFKSVTQNMNSFSEDLKKEITSGNIPLNNTNKINKE